MLSVRERTGKLCVLQCRLQLSDDVPSVMPAVMPSMLTMMPLIINSLMNTRTVMSIWQLYRTACQHMHAPNQKAPIIVRMKANTVPCKQWCLVDCCAGSASCNDLFPSDAKHPSSSSCRAWCCVCTKIVTLVGCCCINVVLQHATISHMRKSHCVKLLSFVQI